MPAREAGLVTLGARAGREAILQTYPGMMDELLGDAAWPPEGRFAESSYEAPVANPWRRWRTSTGACIARAWEDAARRSRSISTPFAAIARIADTADDDVADSVRERWQPCLEGEVRCRHAGRGFPPSAAALLEVPQRARRLR